MAIFCHECKKVFELLEASAACPHCRYSVLPATKMPDGQEYVVKLPASAEAVKKRLRLKNVDAWRVSNTCIYLVSTDLSTPV